MDLIVKESDVYIVTTDKDETGDTIGSLRLGIFAGSQEDILNYINDVLDWDYQLVMEDLMFEEVTLYTISRV